MTWWLPRVVIFMLGVCVFGSAGSKNDHGAAAAGNTLVILAGAYLMVSAVVGSFSWLVVR